MFYPAHLIPTARAGASAYGSLRSTPLPHRLGGYDRIRRHALTEGTTTQPGKAVEKELGMRTLSSIAEHQMVVAFLLAERTSPDFGRGVEHFRSRLGIPEPVISQPDLSSVGENQQRARVLGYRGGLAPPHHLGSVPALLLWKTLGQCCRSSPPG